MSLHPSSLQGMSSEWIEAVYQAASEGNSQKLYRLIEQIPPHSCSLAAAMTELVNHFNFRQIRKLTQRVELKRQISQNLN